MKGLMLLSLLFLGLILLGAAVTRWLRRHPADSDSPWPVSNPLQRSRDRLPEGPNGDGENGLAAFYAYQMAASKIDRAR